MILFHEFLLLLFLSFSTFSSNFFDTRHTKPYQNKDIICIQFFLVNRDCLSLGALRSRFGNVRNYIEIKKIQCSEKRFRKCISKYVCIYIHKSGSTFRYLLIVSNTIWEYFLKILHRNFQYFSSYNLKVMCRAGSVPRA